MGSVFVAWEWPAISILSPRTALSTIRKPPHRRSVSLALLFLQTSIGVLFDKFKLKYTQEGRRRCPFWGVMSANYWESTQRRHWQFTKEQLASMRQKLEDDNAELVRMFPLPQQRHLNIYFNQREFVSLL